MVLNLIKVLGVMSVCRGPRRRWTHIKLRKTSSSESKKKTSLKTSSSPPRSTAPDIDIDAKLNAQLITVNKSIDDKISANAMSQFSEMLASFRSSLPNSSFSVDPAVPGQSVSHTESPSLHHCQHRVPAPPVSG